MRKIILTVLTIVFLVCCVVFYNLFSDSSMKPSDAMKEKLSESHEIKSSESTTTEPVKAESFSGVANLYELLLRNEKLSCQVVYTSEIGDETYSGNILTAGQKMRGDFIVPSPDLSGKMTTSIIVGEEIIWQWTDLPGSNTGIKQVKSLAPETLEKLVAPIGFLSKLQYECQEWSIVEQGKFETPEDILFTDLKTSTFEEGVIFEEEV